MEKPIKKLSALSKRKTERERNTTTVIAIPNGQIPIPMI